MGPDPDPTSTVPGMTIWGWMTPTELTWLGARAAEMESIVEIGCLRGRSAFALLTACPGPVYCIDPWDDPKDQAFPAFMRDCGHFPNLRAVRDLSPQASAGAPTVDMTFIDGAHAYAAVLADIAAWLPKTRRLLCGHDYQNEDGGYPGVAEAVHAVFGVDRVVVPDGTSIWAIDLEADRRVLDTAPTGTIEDGGDEYGRFTSTPIEWPAK